MPKMNHYIDETSSVDRMLYFSLWTRLLYTVKGPKRIQEIH